MTTGTSIVIEGIDGSGKGEQTQRLVNRLLAQRYPVAMFDFPQYAKPSAYFVEKYLAGQFGSMDTIDPKTASLFFALDRYDAKEDILAALKRNDVVVFNRYVASNCAHQGSKIGHTERRRNFFQWNYHLEHEINGMPKPRCNIILFMPPENAQQFVDQKKQRVHLGDAKRDLHENNLPYLHHTAQAYRELTRLYPDDFCGVECVEEGRLLSLDEIHEKIWALVAPMFSSPRVSPLS